MAVCLGVGEQAKKRVLCNWMGSGRVGKTAEGAFSLIYICLCITNRRFFYPPSAGKEKGGKGGKGRKGVARDRVE